MSVIMKIDEEEKDGNGSALVSVVYDGVFRKMTARGVEAKDPGLNFDDEFSKEKNILEACKARIDTIVRARPGRDHSGCSVHTAGSSHAKQTAAAETAAKKAEAATRAFEEAQRRVETGQFNPDLPIKDAKRHLWMLGKLATTRQNKLKRRQVPKENYADAYEEEPEEKNYAGKWEYERLPRTWPSKGSNGWEQGGPSGSKSWKGSKGWKGGNG